MAITIAITIAVPGQTTGSVVGAGDDLVAGSVVCTWA
jgi:hypothetical protein